MMVEMIVIFRGPYLSMSIPPKGPSRPPSMLLIEKAAESWARVQPYSAISGLNSALMP